MCPPDGRELFTCLLLILSVMENNNLFGNPLIVFQLHFKKSTFLEILYRGSSYLLSRFSIIQKELQKHHSVCLRLAFIPLLLYTAIASMPSLYLFPETFRKLNDDNFASDLEHTGPFEHIFPVLVSIYSLV